MTSFMNMALQEAHAAGESGDVPIGCVVVHGGTVVARAGNRTVVDRDPTAHAELVAIRAAAAALGSERLADCDLYVTLEPCAMCAGAIAFARIRRLYYGAADRKGRRRGQRREILRFAVVPPSAGGLWRTGRSGGLGAAQELLRGTALARV